MNKQDICKTLIQLRELSHVPYYQNSMGDLIYRVGPTLLGVFVTQHSILEPSSGLPGPCWQPKR